MTMAPSPNHHHDASAAGRQGPPWDHCSLLFTTLGARLFFSVSILPSLDSGLDSADTLSAGGGESTAGIGFGTSVGTCATCGGNTRGISKNCLTAGIRKAEGKIGRKVYTSGNEKGDTHTRHEHGQMTYHMHSQKRTRSMAASNRNAPAEEQKLLVGTAKS
jgi:hypothetical protein